MAKESKSDKTKKTIKVDKKIAVEHNHKTKPSKVDKGHVVAVDYVGTLSSGEEFDNSKNNGPIKFKVGDGHVIKGFDDAVVGMKVNESKKFTIPKHEAYGDINPALMHKIPVDKLPPDLKSQVKVGGFLVMQSPTGQQIPAKVQSMDSKEIVLDLNHPLAGKDLTFDITVKDISHQEEHEHNHDGHDHSGHDHGHHDHEHMHESHECECGGECKKDSDCKCDGDCKCAEGECGCSDGNCACK